MRIGLCVKGLFLFLMLFVLNGCLEGEPRRLLLTDAAVEVKPAPEIYGASREMAPHSGAVRISGGARFSGDDREYAGRLENDYPGTDHRYAPLFYDIVSGYWYGALHVVSKGELYTWGFSVGYDNALYVAGSAGINTEHFDAGVTLSLGWQIANQQYRNGFVEGEEDYNYQTDFIHFASNLIAPGIYASVYEGRLSLTYSGSVYWPENVFNDDKYTLDPYVKTKGSFLPTAVFTHHLSVGYIFDKGIGIRLGVTNIMGDFNGFHWSGFGGVELNL